MARPRLVRTLPLPEGGFARGTRGAVAFAEEAVRVVGLGADELALVEPPGSDRRTFLAALERTAASVRIPVLALAGVTEVDELRALVEAGADRIDPGPSVVATPSLLEACAARLGTPRVIARLAVRRDPADGADRRLPAWARERPELHVEAGGFEVVGAHGAGTGLSALAWAALAARRGAGELLLLGPSGVDPVLVRAVGRTVRLPIAVRTAGDEPTERELLLAAGADAVHVPANAGVARLGGRVLAALDVPA